MNRSTSFLCNSSWGSNLCFQGVCISVSPIANSCNCESGWERDNYLYHSEGCTIPSLLPLICTVLSFALSLGCTLLVFRRHFPQTQGHPRQLLALCMLSNLIVPFELLGLQLQNGFYEVFIVCASISSVFLFSLWAERLIGIVLKPLFQVQRKLGIPNNITSGIRVFLLLFNALFLAIGLGQLITCRWEDNTIFNVITDCLLIVGVIFMSVAGTIFYVALLRLENSLTQRQRQEMCEEVKLVFLTLTSMRRHLLLVMVGNALLCLPWVTMNRALGSSPYSWIQTFFNTLILQYTFVSVTHKLLTSSAVKKNPNEKDREKRIAIGTHGSLQVSSTTSQPFIGRMGDFKDPDAPDSISFPTTENYINRAQPIAESAGSGYFQESQREL